MGKGEKAAINRKLDKVENEVGKEAYAGARKERKKKEMTNSRGLLSPIPKKEVEKKEWISRTRQKLGLLVSG